MKQELRIILLILIAFGMGLAVLIAKPEYRIPDNLMSNRDYYPAIASDNVSKSPLSEKPAYPASPMRSAEDHNRPESIGNEEDAIIRQADEPIQQDFEF